MYRPPATAEGREDLTALIPCRKLKSEMQDYLLIVFHYNSSRIYIYMYGVGGVDYI
ncbi:hypothetical protein LguiA_004562 [Lonicera macranthoides]